MAAGAIPPPQFFERRRRLSMIVYSIIACREWRLKETPEYTISSITRLDGRRA